MEIHEIFPDENKPTPLTSQPKKIIILALSRDSKGLEAKNYGEVLHDRLPSEFNKPLVKVFRDVDWRDFQRRLRSSTDKWSYLSTCAVFIDGILVGDDEDFKEYLKNDYSAIVEQKPLQRFQELDILDKIGKNPLKSYVFFDINIHQRKVGRLIFEIDSDVLPKSTKLFLELCCYQKLILPDDIKYRGQFHEAQIKRVVKDSWIEAEIPSKVCTNENNHETQSGKHDRRGTLSLSYDVHKRLISSHFTVTLDECGWMDKHYRPIGRLIDGENVLHMIENVKTAYESPLFNVAISHCGILHSPSMMTTADFEKFNWTNKGKMMTAIRESYREAVRKRLRQKPVESTEAGDTIEFIYSVPREVVEERAAIQWDPEARHPSYIRNVAVTANRKEASKTQLETFVHFSGQREQSPEEKPPIKTEPFGRDTGDYNYYHFAERTLKKITPRLLLAWAQGIDSHYTVKSIEEEIDDFLKNAVNIVSGTQDDIPHNLDVPSGHLFPERYLKCLYSLPTELLALLREMIDDYFIRAQPLSRALSDDVISAHMLTIIDVTRRMIESTTDVIQNLENFDLITDMIDELILKKIEGFEEREKKSVKQKEKRIGPFTAPTASTETSRDILGAFNVSKISQIPSPAREEELLSTVSL